jgi:hypothetical protein
VGTSAAGCNLRWDVGFADQAVGGSTEWQTHTNVSPRNRREKMTTQLELELKLEFQFQWRPATAINATHADGLAVSFVVIYSPRWGICISMDNRRFGASKIKSARTT